MHDLLCSSLRKAYYGSMVRWFDWTDWAGNECYADARTRRSIYIVSDGSHDGFPILGSLDDWCWSKQAAAFNTVHG